MTAVAAKGSTEGSEEVAVAKVKKATEEPEVEGGRRSEEGGEAGMLPTGEVEWPMGRKRLWR